MTLPPSVPRLIIEIPFEGTPHVRIDALTFEESLRLVDGITAQPKLEAVVAQAYEITEVRA